MIPSLPVEDILELLHSDKKNEQGTVYYSLLKKVGNATYNQTVSEQMVARILERYMSPGSTKYSPDRIKTPRVAYTV
jgi:3-dehydroquinate synthetase